MNRSFSKYLFTLGVPLMAAAVGLSWIYGPTGTRNPAVTYDTVQLSKGAIRKLVSTSGPVRALVTVSVGSQLSGQIQKLDVDFNSEVKENDVLATLDDKTFTAKVAQAKADLAMAKAQLTNQEATLLKSEAVLRNADRVAGRQQALANKGIAATVTVDTAQRDMEVAKAEIAVAKAQIESAKAQIEQRGAQLQQAEIDLERTRIRSPINGTVISRTVDVGQTVAASLQAPELFKIAQDLRRIRIEAQVNEADVGAIAEGNKVEFTVDAYPERKFRGKVTQVRLAATELQNVVTYTVIIEADNDDRQLFPGMTANVQIESATRDGVARIPVDALRYKPRGAAVTAAGGAPAVAQPGPGSGGSGQRGSPEERERRMAELAEQLKNDVGLTDEQIAKVREALAQARGQGGRGGGGTGAPGSQGSGGGRPQVEVGEGGDGQQRDMAQVRARMIARVNDAVAAVIMPDQRPRFESWKRGRESARTANIWLLDASNQPVSRQIRVGIADDQFAEVLGTQLKPEDRIIVRQREAKK